MRLISRVQFSFTRRGLGLNLSTEYYSILVQSLIECFVNDGLREEKTDSALVKFSLPSYVSWFSVIPYITKLNLDLKMWMDQFLGRGWSPEVSLGCQSRQLQSRILVLLFIQKRKNPATTFR